MTPELVTERPSDLGVSSQSIRVVWLRSGNRRQAQRAETADVARLGKGCAIAVGTCFSEKSGFAAMWRALVGQSGEKWGKCVDGWGGCGYCGSC